MLYPYITLGDGTEILHTQIISEKGQEKIEVQFERVEDDGFASARCILPSYEWIKKEKFSPEEINFFNLFLEKNASLIFKYARVGGLQLA